MNPLQIKLLEMLKWFHSYCGEHGFRYYMIGGTMLGAIRHQGFIPWDDDIDVAMPRKDYEAFLEQVQKDTEKIMPYLVESPYLSNKDYIYPFTKLYDTTTTAVEDIDPPIKRGVFLDIFPLDGAGDTYKKKYKTIYYYGLLRNFILSKKCKGRPFYKELIIALCKRILNAKRIAQKINAICKEGDFETSKLVGSMTLGSLERTVMPRDFFGTPQLYTFEKYQFYGVENADAYLKHFYGDYMQIPPVEKRVVHAILHCDLNTSYLSGK